MSAPEKSQRPLLVAAALMESEGRLLICQRRKGAAFELKWEFPGGKVKPGESAEAALQRELEEELGVRARIGAEVYRTRHQYRETGREIDLRFFAARTSAPAMRNRVFEKVVWAKREALAAYDFLPADRELVLKLAAGLEIPAVEQLTEAESRQGRKKNLQ
jgi:8-oxo-dGTP diphosphatase